MSAQDRIAAVLATVQPPDPEWIAGISDPPSVPSANWPGWALALLAADPTLAQDIEDGEAMRRLREALPDGWQSVVILTPVVLPIPPDATIAEAANACREELEASRG